MKTLTMTIETGLKGPAVRERFDRAPKSITIPAIEGRTIDGAIWQKFGYHERGVIFYTREVERT